MYHTGIIFELGSSWRNTSQLCYMRFARTSGVPTDQSFRCLVLVWTFWLVEPLQMSTNSASPEPCNKPFSKSLHIAPMVSSALCVLLSRARVRRRTVQLSGFLSICWQNSKRYSYRSRAGRWSPGKFSTLC